MPGLLKRIAVFLLGAYALVAQVSLLREFLVVFLGNELCLGVIFSSWFLGVGVGAAASTRAARRTGRGERPFVALAAILAAASPLIVFLIRILRSLASVPPGEYIPFSQLLLSTWALVFPFSFLIGFIFPFACLLALGGPRGDIRNVGRVYVLEALGSVCGGALFSYILVGRVSTFHILFGWGAVFLFVLFLLSRSGDCGRCARRLTGALFASFALVLIGGGAGRLDRLSVALRWRSINPSMPLVESVDSRYENITLGENRGQFNLFGNGHYYFSFPDPYGYASVAHMIMAEHPRPKRVLLVGGGAGGLIREILKHGLDRLDYVELDPRLISVTERHLDSGDREALRSPPVAVHYGDGRRFVKETRTTYDIVILMVPEPSTAMLNRFYTREFYEEVKRVLAPRGVLATRLSAPVDYYGWEVGNYAGSVYRTLKEVFPFVIVTPTEENYFFAASTPGVVSPDMRVLEERWRARGVKTDYFGPHHFIMWWLPERVRFVNESLEAQTAAPLNTDFQPVTYFFNLILWARFSGSGITKVLKVLDRAGLSWYVIAVVLLFLARLVYLAVSARRRRRQSAFHALSAIGTTGFTAMALEIILIYSFQNTYGYVYQMLGMIVALFMTGLAAGGLISNGLLARPARRVDLWMAAMEFALAAYAAAIPIMLKAVASLPAGSQYAFMFLVFVSGLLTGAEFPVGSALYMRYAENLGRSAALVDGWDHMGACAGSFFTGVIAVPLLGVGESCLLLVLMNLATGLLLIKTREP